MMCEFTEDSITLRQRLAEVEVIGPFACGQIKLSWSDEPRPTSPRLESEIDRVWNSELASAQQAGAVLFNGDLVRLIDHHSVGSTLRIDVGPTDYKSFLGTNLRN
ncbi:MAG: hypothetical protein GXP29_03460, partial [Planctomycetes bacterium]|nr:hypothetical protein [Planctomycetota bacterium]